MNEKAHTGYYKITTWATATVSFATPMVQPNTSRPARAGFPGHTGPGSRPAHGHSTDTWRPFHSPSSPARPLHLTALLLQTRSLAAARPKRAPKLDRHGPRLPKLQAQTTPAASTVECRINLEHGVAVSPRRHAASVT